MVKDKREFPITSQKEYSFFLLLWLLMLEVFCLFFNYPSIKRTKHSNIIAFELFSDVRNVV